MFSLLWVHTQEWGCWPTWPLHIQPEELPDCPQLRLYHFTSRPPQRVPTPGASHRSPQWTLSKCTDRGTEVSNHPPLLQWLRTCSSRKRVKTRACRGVGRGWHGAAWVLGASSHRPAWGAQASYFPRGGQLWGEVGSTWSHQEPPLRLVDAELPAPWPQWGLVTPGDACRCAGRVGAGRGPACPGVEPGKLHCLATLRFPGTQAWELYTAGGGGGEGRACRWPAGSLVLGHRHRTLDCAKAERHPQEDAGPGVGTQQGTEAGISGHSTWVLSLSPPQLAV